jgi:hypothetical protein
MKEVLFKSVIVDEILELRHVVLRNGLPLEEAKFEKDNSVNTKHFGILINQEMVGCLSFVLNEKHIIKNVFKFQLRGMAIKASHQNQGLGKYLLTESIKSGINSIWCNARVESVRFYKKCGWLSTGENFNIPNVGLHKLMYLSN